MDAMAEAETWKGCPQGWCLNVAVGPRMVSTVRERGTGNKGQEGSERSNLQRRPKGEN